MQNVVVIGLTDVGRRVCSLLSSSGISVVHLNEPSDAEVRAEVGKNIDGVVVLLHDDIKALRYSLMVHHMQPDTRLFVAMFDLTVRTQLRAVVPGCILLSPAAISVPSIVAAALDPHILAIRRATTPDIRSWVSVEKNSEKKKLKVEPYCLPKPFKQRGLFGRMSGQFRPFDSGSRVLLGGRLASSWLLPLKLSSVWDMPPFFAPCMMPPARQQRSRPPLYQINQWCSSGQP